MSNKSANRYNSKRNHSCDGINQQKLAVSENRKSSDDRVIIRIRRNISLNKSHDKENLKVNMNCDKISSKTNKKSETERDNKEL